MKTKYNTSKPRHGDAGKSSDKRGVYEINACIKR